jgi:hypothetical protein
LLEGREEKMIGVAIFSGIALAAFLTRLIQREYRRQRHATATGGRRNTNVIAYRRHLKRGAGMVRIVIENEFCKDLQGY